MSTGREAQRLSDFFPADAIENDGTFVQLDECSSEKPGSLAYCQNQHYLKVALANDNVSAVIAPVRLARQAGDHPLVVAEDSRLEFFRLYKRLSEERLMLPDLEPGRGTDCEIHPTAVVADLTRLGDRVTIGARALVLDGSCIGDDTFIAPGAIVGAEGMVTVDDETGRLRIPHAGGVRLGRNVVVLSQAVIARSLFQRFTSVGDETQVGINSTIGHGVQIGARCIIRGSAVISGRATVQDDAIVSLCSCVADARTVGKGARVMMGSVVVSNVEPGASVSGNFAYDHREHVNDFIREDAVKLDVPLQLRLKGGRSYVQSADMYDAAVAALSDTWPPADLRRLHLVFRVFTGRELALTSDKPEPDERVAVLSFEAGGEKHKLFFVHRGGQIAEQVPYDEDAVFERCTLDAEARRMTFSWAESIEASLTESVVAATKLLHLKLFPEAQGKWVVTQMDSEAALYQLAFSELQVTLVRNLGEHLTKSEVAIDGEKVGLIFFSLK